MDFLLACSTRAALTAATVWAVLGSLRVVDPAARHRAWCAVLAGMLLLPAALLWLPKISVPVLPPLVRPPVVEPWIAAPPEVTARRVPAETMHESPTQQPSASVQQTPDFLFGVYLLGAGVLLARLLWGTAQAASLRKGATREQEFLVSSDCVCPLTVGWRRPTVILPPAWREWPRAELEAVLRHEREHVRRRDPLVQWLAALNRCIFWFHPLAWWLERRLALLAEEACDLAVVASGHDPHEYSEYLLNQARAIQRAGARIAIPGSAMGRGSMAQRIGRLLEPRQAPEISRRKAVMAGAMCTAAVFAFTACQLSRAERAAPGQPTMNELMHRRADTNQQKQEKYRAMTERARGLTPAEEQGLLAHLKETPQDMDSYWTLARHYEYKSDLGALNALRLWYIEHQPGGGIQPGNIDPRFDRAGYERGKALWLAHVKRAGAGKEIYWRAADFLEGGDRPLAESVLQTGRKTYPDDSHWAGAFGRHYAQALLGSGEPVTEFNVFRVRDAQEAQSSYARTVRAQLAESTDADLLAQTAQYLLAWNSHFARPDNGGAGEMVQLAQEYVNRALALQPDSHVAKAVKQRVAEFEQLFRAEELSRRPPSSLAAISDSDRILLTLRQMEREWMQKPDNSATKARELLELIGRNPNDPLYGDALFESHIILGKLELRHGDKKAAARDLLAAAETPGSEKIRRGEFEMNLPRSLVDWGDRRAVAEFFERMAPKTARSKEFQEWAAEIRKGINPDLLPTFSFPSCSQGPC